MDFDKCRSITVIRIEAKEREDPTMVRYKSLIYNQFNRQDAITEMWSRVHGEKTLLLVRNWSWPTPRNVTVYDFNDYAIKIINDERLDTGHRLPKGGLKRMTERRWSRARSRG